MGWLAKIRVCLITTAAFILIALAVAFSVLRAVLPHATGYLAEVDQALEQQIGLPLNIASMDAGMNWLQPQLKLLDVQIYNADGQTVLVEFDEVIFTLSYLDSLRHMTATIGAISLNGAELSVERDQQGLWSLQGVRIATSDSELISDELVHQINNTNFSLLNSSLHLRDGTQVLNDMDFSNVNIEVENLLDTHALQVSVDLPESYGKSLRVVAEIKGDLLQLEATTAELYVNAQALELAPVFDKLGLETTLSVKGMANAEFWLTVENRQVKQIKSRTQLSQFKLSSADQKQSWEADSVSGSVFWQAYSDAWRFDLADLAISRNGRVWAQPGNLLLRENAASGYQISASYFKLDDLHGLLPLLPDKYYSAAVKKIAELHAMGEVYNLSLTLPPKDKTTGAERNPELSAVFHGLGFSLTEPQISLSGLDGRLVLKDDQLHLLLASDRLVFESKSLFRQPLAVQSLGAIILARRDKNDWVVSADAIQQKNADITTHSRLYAIWPETGKLYLDMQTDFRDAAGASVANYYPVGIMSPALISWLDTALSGGQVETGSFIFKGETDDFPFAGNQGVMAVQFQVNDLALKFLPDWPALEQMSAQVHFYNESLQIEHASARVYRGQLRNARLSIDNLQQIQLNIDGEITAPADDVQQYVWNSGLNSILGEAMQQLPLLGNIELALKLRIPLDDETAAVQTSGVVTFKDNVLDLPAMNYQLTDLNGELSFSNASLTADALTARFEGAPVSISASTVVSPRKESIFQIKGHWPIDHLLKDFTWLPENWFSGAADWDLAVHVPLVSDENLWLELASSLQGVTIAVSDKLNKPAADKLPLQLKVRLLDAGLWLDMSSPDVFAVLAQRDAKQAWQLAIDAPWLQGRVSFDQDMATDSVVAMQLEYVDLSSLVKTQLADSVASELKPTSIPSLNFHADKLDWDAWKFTDVEMNSKQHSHGMQIKNISVRSRALAITGKGNWLSSWQHPHETNVKLQVRSLHLGDALASLGHPGIFDRGELEASIDWQWLAEPYQFSLDAVSGVSSFKLENGVMLDVKPGAGGRLLGLLNVLQLPRRLLLDFGDVYKDGFVFDTITGDMEFIGGNAKTRNIKIDAASASINIDGRIGLAAEDYDLAMEVRPNSAAAAFTGGTIAGGPIVGAGLVLLDKLLGIDKLTREKYSITGKWDNPVIEQTSKIDKAAGSGENE